MKPLFRFFTYWFNSTLNHISFYYAKKKADNLHKLTGKRYHVVPKTQTSLMVVDNSYVDAYNKHAKHLKRFKKITILDLLKMSYYSTSVQGVIRK